MSQAISFHPGYVRGVLEDASASDSGRMTVRLLALACYDTLCNRALIVGGEADVSLHKSVCRALEELSAMPGARDLKVALVSTSPGVREVYERARKKAAEHGIPARVFDSEPEALAWLHQC